MRFIIKAVILIVVALLVLFAIISIFGPDSEHGSTDPIARIKASWEWLKAKVTGSDIGKQITDAAGGAVDAVKDVFSSPSPLTDASATPAKTE